MTRPYDVMLGIDHAGRDTGERITLRCIASDKFTAAMVCEAKADANLDDPETCYTHAMTVVPVPLKRPAVAMAYPVAA